MASPFDPITDLTDFQDLVSELATTNDLPWKSVSNGKVKSTFFPYINPDSTLWDKLSPYRLLVIDVTQNPPTVVGGSTPPVVSVNPLGNGTLAFTPLTSAWEFRLPITPQQLVISDAYAINTSATLKGVIEEHSGVRFKNINIQGTFGVWPGRSSISSPPSTPNLLQSVFGGTLSALSNLGNQITSIASAFTTGSSASKPKTERPDYTGVNSTSSDSTAKGLEGTGVGTGFYQQLMFSQFLEQYVEAKKDPTKAGWRLVLDMPSQSQSFVVTPMAYTWNQNVNKPLEVSFTLQLKAWRRIDLKVKPKTSALDVTKLQPGALQKLANTIGQAQVAVASAYNAIGAVRSDVDNVLNIVRQTGLFVKQLSGVAIAASDLPSQLTQDYKSTILDFTKTIKKSNLFPPASTDTTVDLVLGECTQQSGQNEGVSQAPVAGGQNGPIAAGNSYTSPINNVFNSPLRYPLFFGLVPIDSLTSNNAQLDALQHELDTVNAFTVADLKSMRATMLTVSSQLANSFGAGDAYYSSLFNLPPPISRTEPMTADEYDILNAFYDLLGIYDILTATNQLDNDQTLNTMEYVSALAATSGIAFSVSQSKIQVPVPNGLTMEQISMRYLGDPQRWLEIATLNNLQEPYLDPNGFTYPLLSNSDGRNIVVGSNVDLFVGQTVYLYSSAQTPTSRKITKIQILSQSATLLTLDGLANLNYNISDNAYLQAYLPGTINSQNVIWIPSDILSSPDDQINIPTAVANVDLVGVSKVDWLLDQYGDLATTNTGDFRLSAGITNLIQALTLKFSTPLGSSLLDPSFGLNAKVGSMVGDTTAGDIYNQISAMITADPRFSGLSGLQVTVQPPFIRISLSVQIAGNDGVFPISFQLPYGR